MGNKEIQEERMRGYFIQATKEILKGEGLKSISVRNIADRAGYSYATLYNYFKDVKDLIFECVKDFQQEIADFVDAQTETQEPGIGRIHAIAKAYLGYFVQYPGIFEMFYLEKMIDIAYRQPTAALICGFPAELMKEDLDGLVDQGKLTTADAMRLSRHLHNVMAGQLLFYLNRRFPESYADFAENAAQQIDATLNIYLRG